MLVGIEAAAGLAREVERDGRRLGLRLALRRQTAPQVIPVFKRHNGAGLVSLIFIHRWEKRHAQAGRYGETDIPPARLLAGLLAPIFG